MSSSPAIRAKGLGKFFKMYARPLDRLLQAILPRGKKRFTVFEALKSVDLEVVRGETVGIIGRNGSGKSTLLQIICGTLTPTKGQVEVSGRVAALLELGAGFNPEFTGRDNVRLNASILGLSAEQTSERFESIVEFSEIAEFIDQPVKTYSSGMFVRLAFAVAIHTDPDIFVVDEALAVGDFRFQAKCYQWLREFRDTGGTVLFVSHDIGAVRQFCDKVIWLERGEVIQQGDTMEVTANYLEAMLGSKSIAAHADGDVGTMNAQTGDLSYDLTPLSRWGSHVGAILACGLFDSDNRRVDVVKWNDSISVKVRATIPSDVTSEDIGIAISLKNLSGTDILVYSTWDEGLSNGLRAGVTVDVVFQFANPLTEGKYMLVCALEDRRAGHPEYLDYLEGALFFACTAPTRFFGLAHVPVKQHASLVN